MSSGDNLRRAVTSLVANREGLRSALSDMVYMVDNMELFAAFREISAARKQIREAQ